MSAQATLQSALDLVDEATLAQHLRISIAMLRRYATGEMRMNWVTCTRLAALPATLPKRADRRRVAVDVRVTRTPSMRESGNHRAVAV